MTEQLSTGEVLPVRIQNPYTLKEILDLEKTKPLTPSESRISNKLVEISQRTPLPAKMSFFAPDGTEISIPGSSYINWQGIPPKNISIEEELLPIDHFPDFPEVADLRDDLSRDIFMYEAEPTARKILSYLSQTQKETEDYQRAKLLIRQQLTRQDEPKAFLFAVWCCLNQPTQTS